MFPGCVVRARENFGARSRGFDVCMRVTFDTREDLDAYEAHPIHKEVVAYNRQVTQEHICFDFESMYALVREREAAEGDDPAREAADEKIFGDGVDADVPVLARLSRR